LFEVVLRRRFDVSFIGGEAFAVDASLSRPMRTGGRVESSVVTLPPRAITAAGVNSELGKTWGQRRRPRGDLAEAEGR
jgi:hypothetical protein